MNSMLIMYGCDMSERFDEEEILDYLKSLEHSNLCKHTFCKGDKVIGEAYVKSADKEYIIYTCPECGGMFYMEGTATALYMKKGRGPDCQ